MLNKVRRRARRLLAIGLEIGDKALVRGRNTPAATAPMPQTPPRAGLRVVVTGGSRGVGRALAEGFAAVGAQVAVLSRDADEARAVAAGLCRQAVGVGVDVSDADAVARAFEAVDAAMGGMDLLINNAGVTGPTGRAVDELAGREFADVLAVNVVGAFHCAAAAFERMRANGGGRIINVSTGAVEKPTAGFTPYATSKWALEGLSRQLAVEGEPAGVCVTTVRLASLRTDMTERAFGGVKASLLPEPESVVPAFFTVAAAAPELVHGRTLSATRLLADAAAELRTQSAFVSLPPFAYPEYAYEGEPVARTDPSFRIYDRAENAFGPSPRVTAALGREVFERSLALYPDERHRPLRRRLAERHGLDEDCFAVGNGSWEVLDRVLEVLTEKGDRVVANKPGWSHFGRLCKRRQLDQVKVPMAPGAGSNRMTHNLDAVARAVTPRTRLVYLVTPSNPEGVVIRRREFDTFLEAVPAEVPILLDEAYLEFADDAEAVSAEDYVAATSRPIIGLRTFSKFFGLAGMRVGYAYARAEHIRPLDRAERIFNVSHLAELAASEALADQAHQDYVKCMIVAERRRLESELGNIGLDVVPSEAPYVLVELPTATSVMVEAFAKRGIFVSDKTYHNKYMMLPVARPEDNDRNIEVMRELSRA